MFKIFKSKKFIYLLITLFIIIAVIIASRFLVVREVFYMLFLSFIIAYAFRPIYKDLIKYGVNKKVAAGGIIGAFFLVTIAAIAFLVPSIIRESYNLNSKVSEVSGFVEKIYAKIKPLSNNETMYVILDDLNSKISIITHKAFGKILEEVLNFGKNLFDFSVIPVIAYYFMSESEKISNKFMLLFPVKSRNLFKEITEDIDKTLGRYIVSQLFLCLIIGVCTFIVLILLKVDFPIILSLINAFFNIIPYFGPLFGAIPAVIIALLDSSEKALYTVFAFSIIQQIEGNFISPKVTGDSVNIHPLLVIILLIIGGKIGGFLGMVLAVPVGVVIKVLYDDINYYLF